MINQTPDFYLLRKPAGVPSSRGDEYSFLDYIKHYRLRTLYGPTCESWLPEGFEESLMTTFGPDREYGLINRLDNDTSGLLYFAKNEEAYKAYHDLQEKAQITKYYVATVYGRIRSLFGRINAPIAHHPFEESKMVSLVDTTVQYRSHPQECSTYWEKLEYDAKSDTTTLMVYITKGVRHQIRCHLASLGYPIVNDDLYTTKKQRKKRKSQGRFATDGQLGLMSVGLRY